MVGLTSAAGLVGYLSEPDSALRSFALHRLDQGVDLLWPEVSNSIAQMYVNCLYRRRVVAWHWKLCAMVSQADSGVTLFEDGS